MGSPNNHNSLFLPSLITIHLRSSSSSNISLPHRLLRSRSIITRVSEPIRTSHQPLLPMGANYCHPTAAPAGAGSGDTATTHGLSIVPPSTSPLLLASNNNQAQVQQQPHATPIMIPSVSSSGFLDRSPPNHHLGQQQQQLP